MGQNPIGISFMPSAEQAAMGPRQGQLEGVPEQAMKILSLRLPRITGPRSIAPQSLLKAPGSAGVQAGVSPLAQVFETLLKSMGGGQAPFSPPPAPEPSMLSGGGSPWHTPSLPKVMLPDPGPQTPWTPTPPTPPVMGPPTTPTFGPPTAPTPPIGPLPPTVPSAKPAPKKKTTTSTKPGAPTSPFTPTSKPAPKVIPGDTGKKVIY